MNYGMPLANSAEYAIYKMEKDIKKVEAERLVKVIIADIEELEAIQIARGSEICT